MSRQRSHSGGRNGKGLPEGASMRIGVRVDESGAFGSGVDIDACLSSLRESLGEVETEAPDLSGSILDRVSRQKPFVPARARRVARWVRIGAGSALCLGMIAFGGWLMGGGLDVIYPPKPRVDVTSAVVEMRASELRASGGGVLAGTDGTDVAANSVNSNGVNSVRFIGATSAAMNGLMKSTMPSMDGDSSGSESGTAALASALLAPTADRSKGGLETVKNPLAAMVRWTTAMIPTVKGEPVNEADLESQFEREMMGVTGGTGGVVNPR